MEKLRKLEGLSLEELEAQRVELLPDREEMQDLVVLAAGAAAAFGSAAGSGAAANNVTVNVGDVTPTNDATIAPA